MAEGALRAVLWADIASIDLGLAWVVGALASQAWMRRCESEWSRRSTCDALVLGRLGFLLTLAALIGSLLLEAAAVEDVPMAGAWPSVIVILRHTHFGMAWIIGFAAWLVLGVLLGKRATGNSAAARDGYPLLYAAVGLFVYSRSIVSHAAGHGDASVDVAADWVHRLLACLWVGIVSCGARLHLPAGDAAATERADARRWVTALSTTATAALCGIVATGLFKAWRAVPDFGQLVSSDYGRVLVVKVALVAMAAGLGGINRFRVLPGLLRALDTLRVDDGDPWRRRLVAILRIEAATLAVVVAAAAILGSTEPPGAG